jgi:hypothetical protein
LFSSILARPGKLSRIARESAPDGRMQVKHQSNRHTTSTGDLIINVQLTASTVELNPPAVSYSETSLVAIMFSFSSGNGQHLLQTTRFN